MYLPYISVLSIVTYLETSSEPCLFGSPLTCSLVIAPTILLPFGTTSATRGAAYLHSACISPLHPSASLETHLPTQKPTHALSPCQFRAPAIHSSLILLTIPCLRFTNNPSRFLGPDMADIHLLKQHSAYKPNLPNSIKCVLESHTGHRTLSQMTYSPTLCRDTSRADANGGFELLLLS